MLKIGLTGGIGSGKSTVADYFAELNVPIIDCDVIAKELVKPNSVVLQQIVDHFGADILNVKDELNRTYLRRLVFRKPQERLWLENLLHPLIWQEIEQKLSSINAPYCIIIIPLLIEVNWRKLVDYVVVVDVEQKKQISRIMARNHISLAEVSGMLKAQATRQERLQAADDIIYNDKSLEHLKAQVAKLHQKYLQESKHATK